MTTKKENKKETLIDAIRSIQKEVGKIKPTGKNTHHGYSYATIEDTIDAIQPLLAKHDVLLLYEILEHTQEGNRHTIKMKFILEKDGEKMEFVSIGQGEDKQGSVVGLPIAQTMARKYFFINVFNLRAGENAESDQNTKVEENKIEKIGKMIEKLSKKEMVEKAYQNYLEKKDEYSDDEQLAMEALFAAKLAQFEEKEKEEETKKDNTEENA